ncbi:hypothetical protein BBK82_26640 [Lentzea guizhouensis]|uniref:Uncharacterized protein n=1 Tax=Lentzea guizhouensis TaxID=1586287 RepID=A0A1B2HN05_9PSEU|nr:hypothetical protein BBK82_26640 [Lentzea guizhouensis]
MGIQQDRTRGSRSRWVLSSASTTDPAGSAAMRAAMVAQVVSWSGSPLAISRGRRQLACSRSRR